MGSTVPDPPPSSPRWSPFLAPIGFAGNDVCPAKTQDTGTSPKQKRIISFFVLQVKTRKCQLWTIRKYIFIHGGFFIAILVFGMFWDTSEIKHFLSTPPVVFNDLKLVGCPPQFHH